MSMEKNAKFVQPEAMDSINDSNAELTIGNGRKETSRRARYIRKRRLDPEFVTLENKASWERTKKAQRILRKNVTNEHAT